jgi:hypothetical protein
MLYGDKTDLIAMSEEQHWDVLATDVRLNSIPDQTTIDSSNTSIAPLNEENVTEDRIKTIKTPDPMATNMTLTTPYCGATPVTEKTHMAATEDRIITTSKGDSIEPSSTQTVPSNEDTSDTGNTRIDIITTDDRIKDTQLLISREPSNSLMASSN